jgi:hypothetical protein
MNIELTVLEKKIEDLREASAFAVNSRLGVAYGQPTHVKGG